MEAKIFRRKAGEIPTSLPEDLDRLAVRMDEAIDTSDIPERMDRDRLIRDQDGRLLKEHSPIREAVATSMASRDARRSRPRWPLGR